MLFSCKKEETVLLDFVVQLENAGAVMPVHIHGNEESEAAFIVVHGGPGESGILKREAIGFYGLEAEHKVIYYDQRASGLSEGNVAVSSISVEQMAEDLNAVVELVDQVTSTTEIYLVSLDWGAAIAVQYLSSSNFNDKVKGYVASSPGFNSMRNLNEMRDTLYGLVDTLNVLSNGAGSDLQAFLDLNPEVDQFNYREYTDAVQILFGIVFNQNITTSGVEPPGYIKQALENNERFVLENWTYGGSHFLESLDVEDLLGDIPVPTKLVWGAHDLLFPASLAPYYLEKLGVPSDAERVSIFPFSAHQPYLEEGVKFQGLLSAWIELL